MVHATAPLAVLVWCSHQPPDSHLAMQVLVNVSEEPLFNLLSALSNPSDLKLLDVRETSDAAFTAMVRAE